MSRTDDKKNLEKESSVQLSQLPRMEDALGCVFRPVEPRPEFVTKLQNRLSDPQSIRPFRALSSRDIVLIVFICTSIIMLIATALKLVIDHLSGYYESSKKAD